MGAFPINWRLKPFLYLYCRAQRKQGQESILSWTSWLWCVVLQIDGLVCYGGLNRRNQRESESGSLMLKSNFYSVLCHKDLYLGFFSRSDISRAIKSCRANKRYKTSD